MCFLLRQGHDRVYDYGWGWFLRCLDAARHEENQARRRRLADTAMALRSDSQALERYLRKIS